MKKFYFCSVITLLYFSSFAQAPYIATAGGDGLGQYGYLEKDAVTFSRLEKNTYNNIAYLSARWWITDNNNVNGNGKEYIYHVYNGPDWVNGITWQCGGDNYPSKRTTDYNAADFSTEWAAGSDCYVSVCARYCDSSSSPASFAGNTTNGAVGFNERHFRVADVDTSLHSSTATYIANSNGNCQTGNSYNVAGSFSINPGTLAGIAITSLILKNTGSALEGTDIPNTALHIYYESAATNLEVFGDGNEIFAGTLSGDWDGNTSDNIFGSTSLNIPVNGKIRVYVLLCEYNSPAAVGKVINLGIINDGIFLSPALDGFTKTRINAGSISQRNIVLPVKFISFSGNRINEQVQLKWTAGFSDNPTHFTVQQSFDGIHFSDAGTRLPGDYVLQRGSYRFALNTAATYFRVVAVFSGGIKNTSNIIHLKNTSVSGIKLLQNPVNDEILLESSLAVPTNFSMRLFDAAGKLLSMQNKFISTGVNKISIPQSCSAQLLMLIMQSADGALYNLKIMRQ